MESLEKTISLLGSYTAAAKARLEGFEERLGYAFNSRAYLDEALTHSSYASERRKNGDPRSLQCNERLEFLGDSVLGLVLSSYLVEEYQGLAEGNLSKIRATLVSEEALADIARKINLGQALALSNGEIKSGGRQKPSVLADGLEAVFGAIMQDRGFLTAQQVILKLYQDKLEQPVLRLTSYDHKSILQELLQKHFKSRPIYAVTKSEGPEHSLSFTVAVKFQNLILGRGRGSTKKRASQAAAKRALMTLKNQPQFIEQLSSENKL